MTMRRLLTMAAALAMALLLVVNAPGTTSAQTPGITGLATVLFGFNEPSGAGDPDAIGIAGVSLNEGLSRICWAVSLAGVEATSIQLHAGGAGETGTVVATLSLPKSDGTATGCTPADAALIAAIKANPAGYYVNVSSSEFPEGAIRGQLG